MTRLHDGDEYSQALLNGESMVMRISVARTLTIQGPAV